MVRRLRLLSTALGTMAGSAFPGGAAVAATPRLPIDPAAFSDDSLAYPPPRLDYDPDVLGMACAPGAPDIGSPAFCTFGNAMTSRMESFFSISITMRSRP